MSLVLHAHPLSSYCWKALIAFYEKGIPFEVHQLELGDPAGAVFAEQAGLEHPVVKRLGAAAERIVDRLVGTGAKAVERDGVGIDSTSGHGGSLDQATALERFAPRRALGAAAATRPAALFAPFVKIFHWWLAKLAENRQCDELSR